MDGQLQTARRIAAAAFEVFAPRARDPSRELVIGAWSTADRFKYAVHRRMDGLVHSDSAQDPILRPGPEPVNLVPNPPSGYQVVAAHIVPCTGLRPRQP